MSFNSCVMENEFNFKKKSSKEVIDFYKKSFIYQNDFDLYKELSSLSTMLRFSNVHRIFEDFDKRNNFVKKITEQIVLTGNVGDLEEFNKETEIIRDIRKEYVWGDKNTIYGVIKGYQYTIADFRNGILLTPAKYLSNRYDELCERYDYLLRLNKAITKNYNYNMFEDKIYIEKINSFIKNFTIENKKEIKKYISLREDDFNTYCLIHNNTFFGQHYFSVEEEIGYSEEKLNEIKNYLKELGVKEDYYKISIETKKETKVSVLSKEEVADLFNEYSKQGGTTYDESTYQFVNTMVKTTNTENIKLNLYGEILEKVKGYAILRKYTTGNFDI